ncbi:MAG TPA: hypothetical protein VF746_03745 [Longimicrobium sp.]|jgi:hypothetical protein
MTKVRQRAQRWAFGAAVAAALGFGATQAAAAPGTSGAAAARCDPERCNEQCQRNIPGSTGVCVGGRFCDCLLGP